MSSYVKRIITSTKIKLKKNLTVTKLNNIKNYRKENTLFKHRLIFSVAFIICLFGLLAYRLGYLQIHKYKFYTQLSQHNQFEELPIEPNRGLVYDRNGVLLAENVPVFSLSIIPDKVPNIDTTIAELQKFIAISPENIRQFKKVLKQHKHFAHVPLKFKLTQVELDNFYANQYRFSGVVIDANMIRHYPLGKTMVSVLGYVGRINSADLRHIDKENYAASNFIGKLGLEKFYESLLHGTVGKQKVEIDATGHIVKTLKRQLPSPGANLYLTVDSKLQQVAINALEGERGSVVVMNPQNGEVLALVSNPGYDPNLFVNGIDAKSFAKLRNSPDKPMYNRAVSGEFPLASTIKPYIALEALDSETITPAYSIHDPGWFKLPNSKHVYWDWQHAGHGEVNVSKAIIVSCDTFFYNLATKFKIDKIDAALKLFGFGVKTGIETTGESAGILASPKWKRQHFGKSWYPGDTVISIIGQGSMSATPVQLAAAVAAIAERGERYKPHLLLKKALPNNEISNVLPEKLTPVKLKNSKYWNIVIKAMQGVITKGTGKKHFGNDVVYTVAGKTGGAQLFHHIYNGENATSADEANISKRLRNHSLFIAFAPVDHPQIAIAVVAENCTIAPAVARKVMDYYLLSLGEQAEESKITTRADVPPLF